MAKDNKNSVISAFSMATSIGFQIVATIAVGLFCGRFADTYFGTAPWLTVAGIMIGITAGVWATYKRIINQG